MTAPPKPRLSHTATRVANHFGTIPGGVSGNTRYGQRFRELCLTIADDVSPDGPSALSEGMRQLVRRAAMLSLECEEAEGRAARGEAFNVEVYGTLCDRVGRVLNRLGLKRREAEPQTIEEYFASKKQ